MFSKHIFALNYRNVIILYQQLYIIVLTIQ